MKCYGVLLDTRSIQRYIFAGDRLKTNIGASYLVEEALADVLPGVLREKCHFNVGKDDWQKTEKLSIAQADGPECEIAYIGGGNALILLKEDRGKEVVSAWTRKLLTVAPGLKTGAALGELRLEEGDQAFKESMDALYIKLKENQNNIFPNVDLPYTGLTVECSISGDGANFYEPSKGRLVSAESLAKIQASEQANKALKEKLEDVTGQGFLFTDSLEDLGQQTGDEYISIVHIDGNNMGERFSLCKDMQQRKALSLKVSKATEAAFQELVYQITEEYEYYLEKELLDEYSLKHSILPIRPIILGGDDVTFVCPGKMGIIYAKRFIENLEKQNLGDGKPFYACAGIALLSTKYPFFRGYQLAEQACGAAKLQSRQHAGSWLEYIFLHGEQEPTLSQIREQEYTGAQGSLYFGPYKVAGIAEPGSLERLLLGAAELGKLPNNKIKELRDVIRKGEAEIALFLQQLKLQDKKLPEVQHKLDQYEETLWCEGRTPYLDMVEVRDFVFEEDKR